MRLNKFLAVLRKQDGLTIAFSHNGWQLRRNGEVIESAGKHYFHGAKPSNAREVRDNNLNKYQALAAAAAYCSDDVRLMIGDVMASLRPRSAGGNR